MKLNDFYSLDHPVRSGQHVRCNRDADLFCGFKVNHQLEFSWLFDGKLGGFGTFEDSVHVCRRASVGLKRIHSVVHQAAFIDPDSIRMDGWHTALMQQLQNPLAINTCP